MMSDFDISWGPCCFCGQPLAPSQTDPCRVTVETHAGAWQVWFCHAQCFKARLASPPEHPDLFEPAHF